MEAVVGFSACAPRHKLLVAAWLRSWASWWQPRPRGGPSSSVRLTTTARHGGEADAPSCRTACTKLCSALQHSSACHWQLEYAAPGHLGSHGGALLPSGTAVPKSSAVSWCGMLQACPATKWCGAPPSGAPCNAFRDSGRARRSHLCSVRARPVPTPGRAVARSCVGTAATCAPTRRQAEVHRVQPLATEPSDVGRAISRLQLPLLSG